MDPRLALLQLRRAWPLPLAAAALGLAALLVLPAEGPLGELELAERAPRVAAGLARERAWVGLALLLAPALLFHAARAAHALRGPDAAWAAARARGAGALGLSAWAGSLAATLIAVGLAATAGELAAGRAGPGFAVAGELPPRAVEPLETGGLRWRVADPGATAPPRSRARFELDLQAGAGSAAEVVLRVRRVGPGGAVAETRHRLARAGAIEVELPPGPGELEFELARAGSGAAIVLRGPAALLLRPVGTERAAAGAAALHLGLALAAGGALALALGAWMGPGIAVLLLLATWTAALLGPSEPPGWMPGARLPEALARIGEGLVPAPPGLVAWGAAAGLALAGLLAARAGLVRGGSRA